MKEYFTMPMNLDSPTFWTVGYTMLFTFFLSTMIAFTYDKTTPSSKKKEMIIFRIRLICEGGQAKSWQLLQGGRGDPDARRRRRADDRVLCVSSARRRCGCDRACRRRCRRIFER